MIANGMVYFGGFLPAFGVSDVVEPALVNPDLPVAAPSAVQRDLGTPYPPSYTAMTSKACGAYLRWLDDGKRDPAAPIVYVFLYLFGLERRLLTELPADDERDALTAEVRRLRAIYGDDAAFERGCNRLLEAADLVRALRTPGEVERPIQPDVPRPEQALTLVEKLQLARTIRAGKPLSFDETMSLYLARHGWPVPTKRREPYLPMVRERFEQRYPGGIRLPEPPAGTASLGRYEGMNPFVWTDLLRAGPDGYLGDPSATDMTALADVVDEVVAELASSEQAAPQALEQTAADLEQARISSPL